MIFIKLSWKVNWKHKHLNSLSRIKDGRMFSTMIKGIAWDPASHIKSSWFESQFLHLQFSFLLILILGGSRWWPDYWASATDTGDPTEVRLLALAWPIWRMNLMNGRVSESFKNNSIKMCINWINRQEKKCAMSMFNLVKLFSNK